MRIEVINSCQGIRNYIEHAENGSQLEKYWEEDVLDSFWEQLCCYAPVDLSERKPNAITDISTLKKQCELLEKLDTNALEKEFERVAALLPGYDDDPVKVVILPGNSGNIIVNERQNGVFGPSMFGNILIQANPLVQGYESWIGYAFAHEYHHLVWGCYWYVLHGGEIKKHIG